MICKLEGCERETYRNFQYCRKHQRRLDVHGDFDTHHWKGPRSDPDPIKRYLPAFKKKYVIDKKTGCWNWIGSRFPNGYGQSTYAQYAHRASWLLFKGEIPKNKYVLHKCDNPSCVNPDHLFLGDQFDNMRDCSTKGRSARGSKNGQSKITEEKAIEIRSYYDQGCRIKDIAAFMKLPAGLVGKVANRLNWRHV